MAGTLIIIPRRAPYRKTVRRIASMLLSWNKGCRGVPPNDNQLVIDRTWGAPATLTDEEKAILQEATETVLGFQES